MLLLDKVLFRRGLRSLPPRATLPSRRRRRRLVQFARPTKRRPPSSRIFYPRAMDFVEWNDRSGWSFRVLIGGRVFMRGRSDFWINNRTFFVLGSFI